MQTAPRQSARPAYDGFYNRIGKRVLDILLSALALCVLWPFYLLIGLLIALDDGFPVLYRAQRGGYWGKTFRICKFRTMVKNAEQLGGGTTALHDGRITKVGAFLRKTKLDELPQLFQVLTGKMSFVGPRPELLHYVQQYTGQQTDILKVRPGITDLSSLTFINLDELVGEDDPDQVYETQVLPKKNALRVQYAQTVSLRTDAQILAQTVGAVLNKATGYIFRKEHR